MPPEQGENLLKDVDQKQLLTTDQESTSTKLQRAVDLIRQGSSEGFVNRAKEAIANPATTALEVTIAAGAGLALNGLQKLGGAWATSGRLVALGLTGVAAFDIYSRGKEAAPAIGDTWNNAKNFEANKAVVASSIGSALFDYPLMVTAGYAGFKAMDFVRPNSLMAKLENVPKYQTAVPQEALSTITRAMDIQRLEAIMRAGRNGDSYSSLLLSEPHSGLKLKPLNIADLTVKQTNIFVPAIVPSVNAGLDGSSQATKLIEDKFLEPKKMNVLDREMSEELQRSFRSSKPNKLPEYWNGYTPERSRFGEIDKRAIIESKIKWNGTDLRIDHPRPQ